MKVYKKEVLAGAASTHQTPFPSMRVRLIESKFSLLHHQELHLQRCPPSGFFHYPDFL